MHWRNRAPNKKGPPNKWKNKAKLYPVKPNITIATKGGDGNRDITIEQNNTHNDRNANKNIQKGANAMPDGDLNTKKGRGEPKT